MVSFYLFRDEEKGTDHGDNRLPFGYEPYSIDTKSGSIWHYVLDNTNPHHHIARLALVEEFLRDIVYAETAEEREKAIKRTGGFKLYQQWCYGDLIIASGCEARDTTVYERLLRSLHAAHPEVAATAIEDYQKNIANGDPDPFSQFFQQMLDDPYQKKLDEQSREAREAKG